MAVRDTESYHSGLRLPFFCESASGGRRRGYICANAGSDTSSTSEGQITHLPQAPDHSAAPIHDYLGKEVGVQSTVIWSDTFNLHGKLAGSLPCKSRKDQPSRPSIREPLAQRIFCLASSLRARLRKAFRLAPISAPGQSVPKSTLSARRSKSGQ